MSIYPDLFGKMFPFDLGLVPVIEGLVVSGWVMLPPLESIFIGVWPPGEESM